MPPKQSPPLNPVPAPGMAQRPGNAGKHPGAPDQTKPRRSSAQVQQEKAQKDLQKTIERAKAKKAMMAAAAVEDQLHNEDMERDRSANHPQPPTESIQSKKVKTRSLPQTAQHRGKKRPAILSDTEEQPQQPAKRSKNRQTAAVGIDEAPQPKDNELGPKPIEVEHPIPERPKRTGTGRLQSDPPHNNVVQEAFPEPTVHMESADESDYNPNQENATEAESEDNELEDESAEEDVEKVRKKNGRNRNQPSRGNRHDVTRARTTSAAPTTASENNKPVKQGKGKSSKSQTTLKRVGGLVEGWKGRNTRKSATSSEDDTAFRFGGFAGDDEDDGEERRDLSTDPKTKKETRKMKITSVSKPVPIACITDKSLFSGKGSKATLEDLPLEARKAFTNKMVPLVYEKVGQQLPWTTLSNLTIQDILNEVYGEGTYNVEDSRVWSKLIGYRLSSMRNRMTTAAHASVDGFISMNPPIQDDPDMLSYIVEILLEHDESLSGCPSPFMYDIPDDRKGLFMNDMILRTLADYFSTLREDIDLTRLEEAKPIGALIMCMQAVRRELEFYRKGTYTPDQTDKGAFSKDNWEERAFTKKDGTVIKEKPKYWVKTINQLKSSTWTYIGERIAFWWSEGVGESRKKSRSRSTASSSGLSDDDDDVEFVLVSESESEADNEAGGVHGDGTNDDGVDSGVDSGLGGYEARDDEGVREESPDA